MSNLSIRPERLRRAAAGIIVLGLAAWAPGFGGIIELGRKGQKASGSDFHVTVEGIKFDDPNHAAGDLIDADDPNGILARICAAIDAHARFTCTVFIDPNDANRNAIQVTGSEPKTMETLEDDPNIRGAGVEYPTAECTSARYHPVTATAQNGNVQIDIVRVSAGLSSVVVTTASKTVAQVNAELEAGLQSEGFTVRVMADGVREITSPEDAIRKIVFTHTDTGVKVSGVGAGGFEGIPALTGWGMLALAGLLSVGAYAVLRRRRIAHRA